MWIGIAIGVVLLAALYWFVDREIYFYEGTRLGARVQAWLYDRWAQTYDKDKAESRARDAEMLARPAIEALRGIPNPLVLDLATGTGRLPLALLSEAGFTGRVTAIDISQGMLDQARGKLASFAERVTLQRVIGFPLPFPDESFDMVACMEALEVMPGMDAPLRELYRVLKPGGFLLASRGTEASGRKEKVVSADQFRVRLEAVGFERVEIVPWWKWFDRATARKPVASSRINPD
ncbi:MAG: class I SAM-dependent methyltransferase [Chloroflexota bacterium]